MIEGNVAAKFAISECFMGVTTVQMNPRFRELLIQFIEEVDEGDKVEVELWAFRNALVNGPKRVQPRQFHPAYARA
jgi:hypothetical protein